MMKYDRSVQHPDKALERSGPYYQWCMDHWTKSWAQYGGGSSSRVAFANALNRYVNLVNLEQQSLQTALNEARAQKSEPKDTHEIFNQYVKLPPLRALVQIRLAMYQVIIDWLIDTHKLQEQGRLLTDWRYAMVVSVEQSSAGSENLRAEYIMRHAIKTYDIYGRKMYFVSSGLTEELRNTSVRGMPEEFFRLPYPTIYLVCPERNPFRIYHDADGWHDVEGVYLVADSSVTPRSVRVIVMGKPNENALHPEDDAFYHWSLFLKEGATMEQCLELSFGTGEGKYVVTRTVEGAKHRHLVSGEMESGEERSTFVKNLPELKEIFTYVMNVVLYIMHPDAEIAKFNLSEQYDRLRQRALKAQGKKRRKLFDEAKKYQSHMRTLLGGSVVVSRRPKDTGESVGTGKKRGKLAVQTYVAGHWQSYLTGPRDGERVRVYRHKRPYWKGPKSGPVSSKVHLVK